MKQPTTLVSGKTGRPLIGPVVGARVDVRTYEALQALAARDGVPLVEFIRRFLEQATATTGSTPNTTKEKS